MKKFLILTIFLPVFLTMAVCNGWEVDYSSFDSIEEVISFETTCISNTQAHEYERLSDHYASRGESYLICNRFEAAFEDFQKSYDFGLSVKNENVMQTSIFRSLFGQAIACSNLNMDESIEPILESLTQIMESIQCSDCRENHGSNNALNSRMREPYFQIIPCSDVPIYGPDQISVQDCIDMINNTVGYARLLICKANSTAVRGMLMFTIDQLANEARQCCRGGGLWKGCFQKLANKYHQWNQKWKMFNTPPDPAWDD